jgi:hypothetical protein
VDFFVGWPLGLVLFFGLSIGLLAGWMSMMVFICLTGNMRTEAEQVAFLAQQERIKAAQRRI